jgi:hypothetical protein
MNMSNIAGKAYIMNVVTPMRPWLTWVQRLSYMTGRALPVLSAPLRGLLFIHFARWTIIKRHQWPDLGQGMQHLQNEYLLFSSNFNGTWDQYLDAFSDGNPIGVDGAWIASTNFPQSIPSTPFKDYVRANQIDADYYYNATPGAAQRDIKAALRVRRAILAMVKQHASLAPADFQKAYVAALSKVQNDLGYQGYPPVASNDTISAEANRDDFIGSRQDIAAALS